MFVFDVPIVHSNIILLELGVKMKAVIIAAGCGSRLQSRHNGMPKTLLTVNNQSIIDIILKGIVHSGIKEVVVVLGYKADMLENYLLANTPDSLKIEFSRNPDWQLSNGISVLCAEEFINTDEEFVLLMSDHIFETRMLTATVEATISKNEALLAIDFNLSEIPDLEDGMKVKCKKTDNDRKWIITGLSKSYSEYSAIDCGMFKLNKGFFRVLKDCIEKGKDSLSDACNFYTETGGMIGLDIGGSKWIDLDTPEMFSFENIINRIAGTDQ